MSDLIKKLDELRELAQKDKPELLPELLALEARLRETPQTDAAPVVVAPRTPWERVLLARNPERPTVLDYIERISDSWIELHGDRRFLDDPAMVGGIARIDGVAFTFFGHQKGKNMKENIKRNYGWAHPEGYRKALRLAQQAEKFNRPVLALIDTAGAFPGIGGEERGVAEAIALNMKVFSVLKTPIICVILGEGGSGGALGIGVGDRVFMFENAWYSVISPEGCATILLRDAKQAEYAASIMHLLAEDLKGFGLIDGIIPEPGAGAHADVEGSAQRLKETIINAYKELSQKKIEQVLKERSKRLLEIGVFTDNSDQKGRKEGFFKRLFSWSQN